MSETRPQRFSETATCPAKIFLLGEYAVLDQRPALVTTLGPRFTLRHNRAETGPAPFHPESPAGELLGVLSSGSTEPAGRFEFHDDSGGGLGASTAQFALLWSLLRENDWESCWSAYRELTAGAKLPPSGADLVAQWKGGISSIRITGTGSAECDAVAPSRFHAPAILIFSASGIPGRKVRTHEHLAKLAKAGFPSSSKGLLSGLEQLTAQGTEALRRWTAAKAPSQFGGALNGYAEALRAAGLEASSTTEDCHWFSAQPGVLGVKGSGALQADALIVLLEEELDLGSKRRMELIEGAQERGLRLVANGLKPEPGLTRQPGVDPKVQS